MSFELLTERFEEDINGILSCFDRLVLFGTFHPIGYPDRLPESHGTPSSQEQCDAFGLYKILCQQASLGNGITHQENRRR